MFYIVESSKSFYEANLDLGPVVERLGFVILHRQDIGETRHRNGSSHRRMLAQAMNGSACDAGVAAD